MPCPEESCDGELIRFVREQRTLAQGFVYELGWMVLQKTSQSPDYVHGQRVQTQGFLYGHVVMAPK